ncbi:MAG: RNA polymerase sigma factor [Pseudomonadota bacterium]
MAAEVSGLSDEEIVVRISEGDSACETELFERFHNGLRLMLRAHTRSWDLAEDLAQETILRTIVRIKKDEIQKPSAIKNFMYGMGKNLFLSQLRRSDDNPKLRADVSDDVRSAERTPEESHLFAELSELAIALLDDLSQDRDRDILARYYVQEQSKDEIRDVYDLSSGQFDTILHRARSRWHKLLDQHDIHFTERAS